jgi:hypothetical protein
MVEAVQNVMADFMLRPPDSSPADSNTPARRSCWSGLLGTSPRKLQQVAGTETVSLRALDVPPFIRHRPWARPSSPHANQATLSSSVSEVVNPQLGATDRRDGLAPPPTASNWSLSGPPAGAPNSHSLADFPAAHRSTIGTTASTRGTIRTRRFFNLSTYGAPPPLLHSTGLDSRRPEPVNRDPVAHLEPGELAPAQTLQAKDHDQITVQSIASRCQRLQLGEG